MNIGLVARSDNTGLGVQTKGFYDHMHPAKTMVVDISALNHNKQYPERYPGAMFIKGFPTNNDVDAFLQGLDCVFVAEAPYNFYLYARARELGIKVAVQHNWEFFDWIANPNLPIPDMIISPSMWHYEEVEAFCKQRGIEHIYLHCPVDRDKLPFRKIKQAREFLHIAGKPAAYDRNGTDTVIEAAKYLQTDAKIHIRFMGEQGLVHQATNTIDSYLHRIRTEGNNKILVSVGEVDNYVDIYCRGDVLLLPRRYGGNCLPLNEALSIGMPVVMTDVAPNNVLLPERWLIPAEKIGEFAPRTIIDIHGADPQDLAAKIDAFYLMPPEVMDIENKRADAIADTISWDTMRPEYQQALEDLCRKS